MGNNFFPTQYFSSRGRILLDISPGLSLPTNSLYPKRGRRMTYLTVSFGKINQACVAHLHPSSSWEQVGHREHLLPKGMIFITVEIRHGPLLVAIGEGVA